MGGVAPGQIWEKTLISLQPTVHVSTSNELSRHSSPDVVHAVCFHGNDTTLATLSPITDDDQPYACRTFAPRTLHPPGKSPSQISFPLPYLALTL